MTDNREEAHFSLDDHLVAHKDIVVDARVTGHEIVTKSGSKKRVYFWIDIECEASSYTIKRRFKEFVALYADVSYCTMQC